MEAVNVKQLQFEMTVVEQSVTVVRSRGFMAVYEDYCEEVISLRVEGCQRYLYHKGP